MKARKIPSVILFLIFSLIIPTDSNGAVTPVAGKACKPVGTTQIFKDLKFTCVKSGKKLIWDNGTLINFEPWTIPINQNQIIRAFRKNVDDWFKNKVSKSTDLAVYIDPKISPTGIQWITDALTFQANLTGLQSPTNYRIYIGKTDAWVINKRKSDSKGLDDWNPKYVCYEDVNEGCSSPTERESFFVWSASSLLTPSEDWQFARSLSHEFFHITQCDLIGLPQKCGTYFNSVPSWLAEGGPNVIGAIFMDRLGNLKYEDQRKFAISLYKDGKNGANTPLSEFSKNVRFGQLFPYEIGMIASEYLIASAGMQSFFDFYSNLPKTSSFEEAFKKTFGIDLSDFYIAFDNARVNLGFYPVLKN